MQVYNSFNDGVNNGKVKILLYISKIIFPGHYCCSFPLFMFVCYYKIKQQNQSYNVEKSDTICLNEFTLKSEQNIDENYSVIINSKFLKGKANGLLNLSSGNKVLQRYVKLILSDKLVTTQKMKVTCSLMFNMKSILDTSSSNVVDTELSVHITNFNTKIEFVKEAELALISSPCDLDNKFIDTVLKNYFGKPKLLHENDVIEISIVKYSEGLLYPVSKIVNSSSSVHFKCTKIMCTSNIYGGYVVIGETTLRQRANIQSFIPCHIGMNPRLLKICKELHWNTKKNIGGCPYGLQKYAVNIEEYLKPFLTASLNVPPAFLITGKKGSGKETLINSIASKYGMHFYKITNFDVIAYVHAQNETKLKNSFFNAKLFAPCIVYMKGFENFGKNNEGQLDDRLIHNFSNELKTLFENNKFPVILFCSSNEENICGRLKREFLEIFKINPSTEEDRIENLKWLLEYNNLVFEGNLEDIARKANTYSFEDLKALVKRAKLMNHSRKDRFVLNEESFSLALDYMQLHYKESVGAPNVPKVQWDDVGGLNEIKEEIMKTINFPLKHSKLLTPTRLRRSGILLFGLPGTGKTLLAKAVATECNLCFLSVKGPELLNMYIGQSEENIREVFERARAASPCIIFFDEFDSLAPNRGVSGDSGGVMDRIVSQLLAEMDGLNEKATVFVIGATNRPDLIDPALLRPGRFDKLLYVAPATDFNSRLSILKALTRRFRLSDDMSLEDVIRLCPDNITGADFYGLCSGSWTCAVRRIIEELENNSREAKQLSGKDVTVELKDFVNVLSSLKSSITEEELRYFENLKKEMSSNK